MGADAPEVVAGTTPSRLHFIRDEQDAVLVEYLLVRAEQPVGGNRESAHSLDRLSDHAGDVACGRGLNQITQVLSTRLNEPVVIEVGVRAAIAITALCVRHLHRTQTGG